MYTIMCGQESDVIIGYSSVKSVQCAVSVGKSDGASMF